MARVIQSRSGNNVYLYESESYRTKDGKVRNGRRIVGNIDPSTGERVCEDWLYKTDHEPGKHLSSQRISELMQSVSQYDRNLFYETLRSTLGFAAGVWLDRISVAMGQREKYGCDRGGT